MAKIKTGWIVGGGLTLIAGILIISNRKRIADWWSSVGNNQGRYSGNNISSEVVANRLAQLASIGIDTSNPSNMPPACEKWVHCSSSDPSCPQYWADCQKSTWRNVPINPTIVPTHAGTVGSVGVVGSVGGRG